MTVEVKVPVLAESIPDATLLEWRKQPGDAVDKDEILIEFETDKVVLEVPAPEAGVLAEILKHTGDTVLARIDSDATVSGVAGSPTAAVPEAAAPASSSSAAGPERLSPARGAPARPGAWSGYVGDFRHGQRAVGSVGSPRRTCSPISKLPQDRRKPIRRPRPLLPYPSLRPCPPASSAGAVETALGQQTPRYFPSDTSYSHWSQ